MMPSLTRSGHGSIPDEVKQKLVPLTGISVPVFVATLAEINLIMGYLAQFKPPREWH